MEEAKINAYMQLRKVFGPGITAIIVEYCINMDMPFPPHIENDPVCGPAARAMRKMGFTLSPPPASAR